MFSSFSSGGLHTNLVLVFGVQLVDQQGNDPLFVQPLHVIDLTQAVVPSDHDQEFHHGVESDVVDHLLKNTLLRLNKLHELPATGEKAREKKEGAHEERSREAIEEYSAGDE